LPSTPSSAPPDAGRRGLLIVVAAVVVVFVAGAVVLVAADSQPTQDRSCPVRVQGGTEPLAVGSTAPKFALPALVAGCFASDDVVGRPMIVNFWASWCEPCRTEFPLLADAHERYGDDLEIVGVLFRDITSDARRFAEERDVEWALVDDDDALVAQAFGVRSLPETFFVAADGTVVGHIFGFTTERGLEREVKRLLRA